MSNLMYNNPPRKYAWIPDVPDQRDKLFSAKIKHVDLPMVVDLRPQQSKVYDQGDLGSCTANAIAAQFDFIWHKQNKVFINPSRLFIYYGEREMEGSINSDSGAMIRDGIKYVADKGVCKETTWQYDTKMFTQKPSDEAINEASKYKIKSYERINSLLQMKQALAEGLPVVFGFTVYESFESDKVAKTGLVPMPKRSERSLGGHAVLAVGYESDKKVIIVRNSWGDKWGDHGYFYMPESYFTKNLTDDFWAIQVCV